MERRLLTIAAKNGCLLIGCEAEVDAVDEDVRDGSD